jgi:hypothetical protein
LFLQEQIKDIIITSQARHDVARLPDGVDSNIEQFSNQGA